MSIYTRVLLNFVLLNICVNEALIFTLTNLVCENRNETEYIIHECRPKAVARNRAVLNFNATFYHYYNNMIIRGELFKKANGYKPWLYKFEIEACRFISKPYNPIAIIIFRLFKNYSNFNHTCPYGGPAYVKGFYLNSKILPNYLPTGDYLLVLEWIFGKNVTLHVKAYWSFVENLI